MCIQSELLQNNSFQASFHVMKPASLAKYLNELGFSEQLSTIISELWSVHAKSVIDTLKKESYSFLKVGPYYCYKCIKIAAFQ